MNRLIHPLLWACFAAIVVFSCRKKDEIVNPDIKSLAFSADTVYFDTTVFTGVKTITQRLTVYNTHDNAVKISEISIPDTSQFILTINGRRQNALYDYTLLGNDKMLILIEAKLDRNEQDTIVVVEEKLRFVTNGAEQEVTLVAPGLDVYFHNGEELDCNTIWSNDHPHLIYNSVLVPEGCKLTIEPGATIYSHARSGILIEGTIEAIGTPEDRILFTDDRLDHPETFNDIFGIWEGIFIFPGSSNNQMDWVVINNAVNGIRVNYLNKYDRDINGKLIIAEDYLKDMSGDDIELILGHSIITSIGNNANAPSFTGGLPFSGIGVLGRNCDMIIHNCLITNCTVGSVMTLINGTYQIINNTLANYPNVPTNSFNRPKEVRTFYASSFLEESGSIEGGNQTISLINNIIYGENSDPEDINNKDEILLSSLTDFPLSATAFNFNIIKTEEFKDVLDNGDNLLNVSPFDADSLFTRDDVYDFNLWSGSNAIDAGFPVSGLAGLEIDLNGTTRGALWDIGAFEYTE